MSERQWKRLDVIHGFADIGVGEPVSKVALIFNGSSTGLPSTYSKVLGSSASGFGESIALGVGALVWLYGLVL